MVPGPVNPAAKKLVQQQISARPVRGGPPEDQVTLHAQLGGSGGGLPAMVRLRCSGRNDRITAPFYGVTKQVFKLPGFIPTQSQARLVISLHKDLRAPEGFAQPCQLNQRRREKAEGCLWQS